MLKTAWRNIWRNKRRTIITIGSAFFAVFFATLMRSMQLGTYDKMIGDVVNSYTGYIQIHSKGYWADKVIDKAFLRDNKLESEIKRTKNVMQVVPRLESFALASFGTKTKGAMVIGIQPKEENELNKLSEKMVQGKFQFSKSGVMIGQGLAHYLNLQVGDTLVLIGQGYHGASAAGKFKINAILHFPSPDLNKAVVYLPLAEAQYFYSAPKMLTSWSISVKNPQKVSKTVSNLAKILDKQKYEVMSWREMLKELVQIIQTDNIGGIIMLAILYMIIGFGIFGTVVMMTAERKREFGVLLALGMHRRQIINITIIETLLLGFIGVILGAMAAIPIVYYYHVNPIALTGAAAESMKAFSADPIIPFALRADFFLNQVYVVLGILIVTMMYPLVKLSRLNIIKSLRS